MVKGQGMISTSGDSVHWHTHKHPPVLPTRGELVEGQRDQGQLDEEGGFAHEAPSLLSLSVTHTPGCPWACLHQVPMARPLGVGLGPSACSWVLRVGSGLPGASGGVGPHPSLPCGKV